MAEMQEIRDLLALQAKNMSDLVTEMAKLHTTPAQLGTTADLVTETARLCTTPDFGAKTKRKCYRCQIYGHYSVICPERAKANI